MLVCATVLALVACCGAAQVVGDLRLHASTTVGPGASPSSAPRPDDAQLGSSSLASRPSPPGYDRSCSPGHGCVFGPAWTDDNNQTDGHNGCDTRNDILRRDLTSVRIKPNTQGCVVLSGKYVEPYTGKPVTFTRGSTDLQIDHVIPLALAWDLGADTWPLDRRVDFANDPLNLLLVDGRANQSKGDRGPGEWMPVNKDFRCAYVERFLDVLEKYDLPIVRADYDSIVLTRATC